jgi:NTE family protein
MIISMAPVTLRNWLEARPFSLVMSSGFFGFYAHAGMLAALESQGLRPAAVAGSSAGGLVAGAWAAGLGAEAIAEALLALRRADFWDPAPGLGLLRGTLFRRRLEALLPVATFETCRVPLSLSVFDLRARRTRVLRSGALAPAIHASCAVPLLFHPVSIDGRLLADGGIADRPGLAGVPSGARVLFHHLARRSPWRLRRPAVPRRPGLRALVIDDLPGVTPFHLDRGALALARARRATLAALDRPLPPT